MRFAPCVQEHLNFKGAKLSKSRGAFVEAPYFLSEHDLSALLKTAPLFWKLDESVIEDAHARLEG
jgi:methionyl-tRNA synthetase